MIRAAACFFALAIGAGEASGGALVVRSVGPMAWGRVKHAAARLEDGRVLLCGGALVHAESAIPWAELFDPSSASFVPTGSMNVPRHGHRLVPLHDGRALAVGGYRNGYVVGTRVAEAWSPETERFATVGELSLPRASGLGAQVLDDGRVVLFGGTVDGPYASTTDAIDVFLPGRDEFAATARLVMSRSEPWSFRVPDGSLMIVGGSTRCCGSPANASRERSQEVLDGRTLLCRPAGRLPTGMRSGDGTPLFPWGDGAVALLGPERGTWTWNGDWRRVAVTGEELMVDPREAVLLSPDLALVLGACDVLLDLVRWSVMPVDVGPPLTGRKLTALGGGCALITGGSDAERPSREATLACLAP